MYFILVFVVPRQKYCESLHKTVRRKTRTVMVGNVPLGSEHPIRIQTMTTSDTKDVAATVEEVFASVPKIDLQFENIALINIYLLVL